MKTKNKIQPGHGWAWTIDTPQGEQLCHWAEPSKEQLALKSRPSTESRAVYVAIVPMGAWRGRK